MIVEGDRHISKKKIIEIQNRMTIVETTSLFYYLLYGISFVKVCDTLTHTHTSIDRPNRGFVVACVHLHILQLHTQFYMIRFVLVFVLVFFIAFYKSTNIKHIRYL